jgi:FKBP-type peptidyl-prolyl cis-trans isomerase
MRRQFFLLVVAFALVVTAAALAQTDTSAPTKVTGGGKSTPDGLQYWDIKVGTGDTAVSGKGVTVHYTGWLTSGKKFDSSVDRGQPFAFNLGGGQVIKGWDEGVAGMKVGGKRQLKIPPALGYGSQGAGGVIPPNATLIFDVELLSVGKQQPPAANGRP